MMRATSRLDGAAFTFNATVRGLAIYLDNWALIRLATGDRPRWQRFVSALSSTADILFSVSNAAELTGPQGKSQDAVRLLLGEIGPHWFPVELDPFEVVNREKRGAVAPESCCSTRFVQDYYAAQARNYLPGSGKVICLSEDFFRLNRVLDWLEPQRASIRHGLAELDNALIKKISGYRASFDHDHRWLDEAFPELPFNPIMPATFAYVNLIRNLIIHAKAHRLKRGDGIDFCHAVVASAFANVATLDKHWKQRVDSLPKPNKLAPIYSDLQLDQMVSDIATATGAGP